MERYKLRDKDGVDGALYSAPSYFVRTRDSERGVALIIVILFVALTSILVTNLAHSTFLQSESVGMIERRLKAEYILKSLVNFAAGLIGADSYNNIDSAQEPWGMFMDGMEIPPEYAQMLGITDPNIRVALQITPVTGGFPLGKLAPYGSGQTSGGQSIMAPQVAKSREICLNLFRNLGFDDKLLEPDHTGLFDRRQFSAAEMVSNLIDYLDEDEESFTDPSGVLPDGIEGQLPDKSLFRNEHNVSRLSELSMIPGFTPNRLKALWPHVAAEGNSTININVASVELLQALDSGMTREVAQEVYSFARSEKGPFETAKDIGNIQGVPDTVENLSIIGVSGKRYEIIARVSYPGQAPYFMRATVTRESQMDEPRISDPVLY